MKVKKHESKDPVIINHRSAYVYGYPWQWDVWIETDDGSQQRRLNYPTHSKRTDGSLVPIKWDSQKLMDALQPILRHWRQVYGGEWRLLILPHQRVVDPLRPDEDRPANLEAKRLEAEDRILEREDDTPGTRFVMARRAGKSPNILKDIPAPFKESPKNPEQMFFGRAPGKISGKPSAEAEAKRRRLERIRQRAAAVKKEARRPAFHPDEMLPESDLPF